MDFLGKAFSWVKSEAEGTFDYLKVKINKSLSSARRFFDNFSENLKQRLIETENFIDKAMRKILKSLSSMARLVCPFTFEKVKEILALLVTQLIEEMKRLASYFKIFKSSTKEAEGATRQQYKCSLDSEDEEKLGSFENLVFEFGKFFGSMLHGEKKGLNLLNDEMFMSYMKDVEEETGKEYKSSWNIHDYIKLLNLISKVLELNSN